MMEIQKTISSCLPLIESSTSIMRITIMGMALTIKYRYAKDVGYFAGNVIMIILASGLVWCSDPDEDLRLGEQLARGGKSAEVQKIIDSLSRSQYKLYATLLIARIQLDEGGVDAANASLAKVFPPNKDLESESVSLQMAYAQTLRMAKRFDEALLIADHIGKTQSGMNRAQASELVSDVLAERQRWTEALDWMNSSISTLEPTVYSDKSKHYLEDLRIKRGKIEQTIDLLTHGLGFRLYRSGNEQRFAKHYTEAVSIFDRLLFLHEKNKGKSIMQISGIDDPRVDDFPISDIYAAAAQVYRGECLLAMDKNVDAAQTLSVAAKDISSPYRGEALRLLGDVSLNDNGDTESAEQYYSQSIAQFTQADRQARKLDRYQVPDASRTITAPPALMRSYQGWGNLEWSQPQPQQVINADTCNWYSDYQMMRAQIQRSMCYFITGKIGLAVKDLDILSKVDPQDRALTEKHRPSNFLRLRDDYLSGRLYAMQAELAEFNGKALVELVQADILFETEQWDLAITAYNRLANEQKLNLSRGAHAYLDYARACAYVYSGDDLDAKRYIDGFVGKNPVYKDTVTYWRSLFLLANLDDTQNESILMKGAQECPEQTLKISFLLKLGQWKYLGKEYVDARKCFEAILKIANKNDYRSTAADNYLALIHAAETQALRPIPTAPAPSSH